MSDVKAAFATYYKIERNRAEACLGDIVQILADPPLAEVDKMAEVLERLIVFYRREEA